MYVGQKLLGSDQGSDTKISRTLYVLVCYED